MNRTYQMVNKAGILPALAGVVALIAWGSPAQAQQGGSLADAARQARAQKQAQPQSDTSRAQQIADQLAEDADDRNAPAGFKTFDAGPYRMWVPAPFTTEAHGDNGTVLTGPRMGSSQPLVLVGNPMIQHWGNNEDAFRDAATQSARAYSMSANCSKTTVANRSTYRCSLAGANLLGHSVSGDAVFVMGSGSIYPVFCVANTESRARDWVNSPRSTYSQKVNARQIVAQEDEYVKQVWQKCETVFQSIHIKEGVAPQPAVAQASPAVSDSDKAAIAQPATAMASPAQPEKAAAPASAATQPASSGGAPSLADIARGLHQPQAQNTTVAVQQTSPVAASPVAQSSVPAGYKVQAFNYCKSSTQCWDASILVPAAAQLVSSDCKQFVYEVKVQGDPFLLLAGPSGCGARKADDPGLIRWKQLVDPESERAPGTASTISAQQMTLDGKTAVITQMRFKRGLADWIGKRAEVETNGSQVVVGCMAPKDHFADGEAICSALIESLRLP